MLKLALSPYDLTTRSRSAALSLLLADATCTLSPADLGDPADKTDQGASELHAVSMLEFARHWSWTRELWDSGALDASLAPDFAEQSRMAWERLAAGPLIAFTRRAKAPAATASPPPPLDAARLIRDIARGRGGEGGGRDPAVRLAIESGILRVCAQLGLAMARDAGDSVLDRLIERASQPMARLTLPIPDAIDEESITDLRRFLAEPIAPLRAALTEVIAAIDAGAPPSAVREVTDRRVAPMADELVREAVALETALSDRNAGVRAVSVRLLRTPVDIFLRAAESAVRSKPAAPDPGALIPEARAAVMLSVKPLAFDAASI